MGFARGSAAVCKSAVGWCLAVACASSNAGARAAMRVSTTSSAPMRATSSTAASRAGRPRSCAERAAAGRLHAFVAGLLAAPVGAALG